VCSSDLFDYDDGRSAALQRYALPEPPDGVFCVNDLAACGVLDALRFSLGLKVPDDMAVIGYDDIPMASWQAYELSSFDQSLERLVDGVLQRLEPSPERRAIRIAPMLVRRSTA
jgi:DNA-binding LacI/PurR family transcriptional regulator